MKTYAAQSGYVYAYHYEGQRERAPRDREVAFVFSVSHDRKAWHEMTVIVSDDAVAGWERAHERALTPTERYAVAKMALFQAFDERAPAEARGEARVREADVDAILDTLGL